MSTKPALSTLRAAIGACVFLACGTTLHPPPRASPQAPAAPAARVTLTEVSGATPGDLGAAFAGAQEPLAACAAAGTAVRIRLTRREDGKLDAAFLPPAAAAFDRRCVLGALTGAIIGEPSTLGSGAGVRPTGFTSVFVIEW